MTNLLDLEPTQSPAYLERTVSEWSHALARWNMYREIRKSESLGHWRAVLRISALEGCTNQNIIASLERVKRQILVEHPELSLKGGDETQ